MSKAPMPDSAEGDTPMPSSFDQDLEFWDESRWGKLGRRLKEEPLIPLGLAMTCYALFGAGKSIRRGDKEQTNRFFRARVYAQAFTLVCVCAGAVYWKEDRDKRKYYQGLLGEKRAKEKREAWIRELELREKEDEAERQRRAMRRAKARGEEPVVEKAEEKAEKKLGRDGVNTSPLGERDLRGLLVESRILGPALMAWWADRRTDDDNRNES